MTAYSLIFSRALQLSILGFIAALNIYLTSSRGQLTKPKELIPPPPGIEHYSLGLRYQLADLFWIRAIQDFGYCEEKLALHQCKENTWMSEMLLTILNLDPKYRIVYLTGGLSLTILVSDYKGASIVFDRGVEQFPNDWQLLYAAAYHALYEEKNNRKAAELYFRAAQNGAPEWVYSLANRLFIKAGKTHMTDEILRVMTNLIKDEQMLQKIKDRIQQNR